MPSNPSSPPTRLDPWILSAALLGFAGVGAGAFGAHALRDRLPAAMMQIYETAVRYQLVHALALLAVGALGHRVPSTALRVARICFLAGTPLFSGSLYALALGGPTAWGAVTPLGGLAWLVGWGALAISAWRR